MVVLTGAPALAAPTGSARVSGTTVSFAAAAGAVNTVAVTVSGRTVTIDDRVAVRAGRGCTAVARDATKVRCTTARAPKLISVALGDKNDTRRRRLVGWVERQRHHQRRGRQRHPQRRGRNDILDGGAGNDDLLGGWGGDTISGGAGGKRDTVDGGDNTSAGDACFVHPNGTSVNCEYDLSRS